MRSLSDDSLRLSWYTRRHHAADATDSETPPGTKVKPVLALQVSRVTPWVRAWPQARPKLPAARQSKDKHPLPLQAGHRPCRLRLDPAPDPGRAPS